MLAAKKAGAEKTAAEEAAVAAAAEAAERETARRRAVDRRHDGYPDARRAPPQASLTPPARAAPPRNDTPSGNGTFGYRSYKGGTYPDGNLPPPDEIEDGRARYHAEYPGPPMFYGPAYPPPWYNGSRPEYYPDRWGRGPIPPW
jgi:hypothetical protein